MPLHRDLLSPHGHVHGPQGAEQAEFQRRLGAPREKLGCSPAGLSGSSAAGCSDAMAKATEIEEKRNEMLCELFLGTALVREGELELLFVLFLIHS